MAGVTHEAMRRMPLEQVRNVLRALGGEPPEWTVNPEVISPWRARWAHAHQ